MLGPIVGRCIDRSGARVVELLSVLCFLPEDAVVEGVYGDAEFAVVFETPPGTEG